jgi:hypothetical protein
MGINSRNEIDWCWWKVFQAGGESARVRRWKDARSCEICGSCAAVRTKYAKSVSHMTELSHSEALAIAPNTNPSTPRRRRLHITRLHLNIRIPHRPS